MLSGFEILVWVIFPQMYLWIHDKYSSIRFKQCELMAEKNTSTLLILTRYRRSGRMAQWSVTALLRWRTLGCNWVSTPACLLPFFFFFIVFFYPLAFYCLFSLLTPLASRDFCENVFLVLCTKIGSFHHIDASFFIVCPLIDHNIASWHCQSVVDPWPRAPGEWIY